MRSCPCLVAFVAVAGLAAQACGGRAVGDAGDAGASDEGGSSGSGAGGSGSGVSGSSGASGSSSGSFSCPATPPSGACPPGNPTCHYYDPIDGPGPTDCGCVDGNWACFSGCSPGAVQVTVDPTLCAPQLQTTTTCHPFGAICSFTFELPCQGDAGAPPGGLDAGLAQCSAWCSAVAPPGFQSTAQCFSLTVGSSVDGGNGGGSLVGTCDMCGS
jgi:hypothetical protein